MGERESVKVKILGVNNGISEIEYHSILLQGRKTIRMNSVAGRNFGEDKLSQPFWLNFSHFPALVATS